MNIYTGIGDKIDAIRDKICEKMKAMTPSEGTAHYNALAEEARTKYNVRVVKSAPQNVPV